MTPSNQHRIGVEWQTEPANLDSMDVGPVVYNVFLTCFAICGALTLPLAASAEVLACSGNAPTFFIQDNHLEAVKKDKYQIIVDENDTLAILVGVMAAKPYLFIRPWGTPTAQRMEKNIPKGISVAFTQADTQHFDVRVELTKMKSELKLTCRVLP